MEKQINTYTATIDGGEGGTETFLADNAQLALIDAVEWARLTDKKGCETIVRVTNQDDETDTAEERIQVVGAIVFLIRPSIG